MKKLSKLDFTDFYYCAEQKFVSLVTSLFKNLVRSVLYIVSYLLLSLNDSQVVLEYQKCQKLTYYKAAELCNKVIIESRKLIEPGPYKITMLQWLKVTL